MAYNVTGPTLLLCMISCINSESLGVSRKRAKALIMASIQDSFFLSGDVRSSSHNCYGGSQAIVGLLSIILFPELEFDAGEFSRSFNWSS